MPDKFDYLHQVPADWDTSAFLAYSINDRSMRSHNSLMIALMAIGKMVEAICSQIRPLALDVNSLRAEVKNRRVSAPPLPQQPQQQQRQSNKGKSKQTYAAATASPTNATRSPQDKKEEKPSTRYRPRYTKKSREILIEILGPLPAHITGLELLTTVNRAVHRQKFANGRGSMKANIMLLTYRTTPAPTHSNSPPALWMPAAT